MQMDIKAVREDAQVVYGAVYTPGIIDTDNETMSAEDIRKMAWDFIGKGLYLNIDVQHDFQPSGAFVVESYVARKDDPDFVEGTWVLGVKLPDDLWASVLDGTINGFSFAAMTRKYTARVLVEVASRLVGITEKSTDSTLLPAHEHNFVIHSDEKGDIIWGTTDVVLGHSHLIAGGTVTEKAMDHSHRVNLFMEKPNGSDNGQ